MGQMVRAKKIFKFVAKSLAFAWIVIVFLCHTRTAGYESGGFKMATKITKKEQATIEYIALNWGADAAENFKNMILTSKKVGA
jgi:hypothetical protein